MPGRFFSASVPAPSSRTTHSRLDGVGFAPPPDRSFAFATSALSATRPAPAAASAVIHRLVFLPGANIVPGPLWNLWPLAETCPRQRPRQSNTTSAVFKQNRNRFKRAGRVNLTSYAPGRGSFAGPYHRTTVRSVGCGEIGNLRAKPGNFLTVFKIGRAHV